MQQAVHKYLKALEAGDVEKAASLFVPAGWVQSPFLGRLPVRDYVAKVTRASSGSKLTVYDVLEYLASGMSEDEILRDFPDLVSEDIRACIAFAADRERKFTTIPPG